MFAALTFDREPLSWSWNDFSYGLNYWVLSAGQFAAYGLLVWLIWAIATQRPLSKPGNLVQRIFGILLTVSFTCYLASLAPYLPQVFQWVGTQFSGEDFTFSPNTGWNQTQNYLQLAGALSAMAAVLLPILADLAGLQLSPPRIWALARLTIKEAVRRRVLWVLLALLLVILFGSWFIDTKPEDQLRTYVSVVSTAESILIVLIAVLLASFSLPDDIRHPDHSIRS